MATPPFQFTGMEKSNAWLGAPYVESTNHDVDNLLQHFRISGYAVIEGLVPAEKIDAILAAYRPLLEREIARDAPESKERIDRIGRYGVQFPWRPPFDDPAIVEHPTLVAFLEKLWGRDDFLFTWERCDTPILGSGYQRWHRDIGLAIEAPYPDRYIPPPVIGAKLALVDVVEENGSPEVVPCTQFMPHPETSTPYFGAEMLEDAGVPSRRLNFNKGSLWILDPRAIHRGTPNRTTIPRPLATLVYHVPGFTHSHNVEMKQSVFDRLSHRGKRLLRNCQILESV